MKKFKANQWLLFSQESGSGTEAITSPSPKLASDCVAKWSASCSNRTCSRHLERLSDPEILRQPLIGYPDFISSSLFSSLPMPGRKAVGFIILTFDLIRQGRNESKVKFIYNILRRQRKHNLFCAAIGCYWYD